MNDEKKAKLKALRERLKNLSEQDKESFKSRGLITTIEGHCLSFPNTVLCYFQNPSVTVVGGFQQWRRAGKVVKKGEHGISIFFPVGDKDDDGDIEKPQAFYLATVFDISQVVNPEEQEQNQESLIPVVEGA